MIEGLTRQKYHGYRPTTEAEKPARWRDEQGKNREKKTRERAREREGERERASSVSTEHAESTHSFQIQ